MIRHCELQQGLTKLCSMTEDQMGLDVSIWQAKTGMKLDCMEAQKETAFLLISGKVRFEYNGKNQVANRSNVFDQGASALHSCKNKKVTITCLSDCEVLIQQTINSNEFPFVYYRPEDIEREVFGDEPILETTRRIVTTIFDAQRAPYSNMVLGEIINQPGIWSSYPPHYHPQPEVYYYRFNLPQGFGTCFIGDEAYKVVDHSIAMIEGGKTHPQNAAPGYAMYYVWMIPHLPSVWLKTRITDPNHEWLLNSKAKIIQIKEK